MFYIQDTSRSGANRSAAQVLTLQRLSVLGADSVAGRLLGPKERAAFQTVLKRRAQMLPIASAGGQNIGRFVAHIAS